MDDKNLYKFTFFFLYMVLKIINATEAKSGANIIIDGMPCTVRSMDVSKTRKLGHFKWRFGAIGMINGQKKVFVVPGHDKLEVPLVEKKRGQVLSKADGKVNLMDLESFETIEVPCPDKEVCEELEENSNCEYWNIEGERIVKRKL